MSKFRGMVTSGSLALLVVAAIAAPSGAVELPGKAHEQAVAHTHGPDGLHMDPRFGRGDPSPFEADEYATWSSGDYDGQAFSTDQPDLSNLPKFHAIYMYPRDGVNRFQTYAAMFQADARQASQRLGTLYGRGVRWDERECAPSRGTTKCLDISVVRSASRSNQFAGNAFSTVERELSKLFKDTTKKYVVWLDALYTGACGQGNLYQDTRRSSANYNERRTLSVIYRPYDQDEHGGFCRGRTVLHEMGHNMGALQSVSPNQFDGAHCKDSPEDIMCYTGETNGVDTGPVAFDFNNDDYWDPTGGKLGWWTVNLSKFICPTAGCASPNIPDF